eukprot:CAMPEP_0202830412 /NCGR_PEP_ID=MMETSP1389-20130828/16148_1 /ASSEMBLY_ACC=CAM_ASM_000865 /TAXON_ID=302021 /ORGANISM="Rhodomonas sp., Strain CCMP768" /LENGTH=57 /DNA_ID=CAMNT_0049504053 /DNA_START=41 /DNA_END=211 /DNA_ORIENTATION=+
MLTKLFIVGEINPFTEMPVGEWALPDEIALAPAGGMQWEPTDPETQYYGPQGKEWLF